MTKNGLDTYLEAMIEGIELDDAQVLAGLKELGLVRRNDRRPDDLDYMHVALAAEDGDMMVLRVAKSTDISLNRQAYRLIVKRMDHEWRGYEELEDDEFDIQTSRANVFYSRLSEQMRGERFSPCNVRYYDLHAEDEGQNI